MWKWENYNSIDFYASKLGAMAFPCWAHSLPGPMQCTNMHSFKHPKYILRQALLPYYAWRNRESELKKKIDQCHPSSK